MPRVPLGPVLPEEAALLSALTRMVAAHTVVEFGYGGGTSARAFLEALPPSGMLYSFDPNGGSVQNDTRHRLIVRPMQDFSAAYVDHRTVDVVFFDADHVLESNTAAWERVAPSLAPDALVLVHDTGYWPQNLWPDAPDFGFVDDEGRRWHRPDEVNFVGWLRIFAGYRAISLCSSREIRHGLSVLQRAS